MSLINQFAVNLQDTVSFYRGRRQFKDLLKYIRKQGPTQSPQQTTRELNAYLDQIVADVTEQLRVKKLETIPINLVQDQFVKKWMGLTLKGNYVAKNGLISNLSTVHRKEQCVLAAVKNESRIFSFTLSLKQAKIEFEKYELHCGPINTNGRISIEARDNAFNVKINIHLKKNTKVESIDVTRAEITKCGNFKVSVTGFGNLGGNSIAKMIIKSILNKHKSEMKAMFEKDLKIYIKDTIEKFL
ncbi:uncharacterized protein LOC135836574 [Planococcus citri]|uniref:uncharacterized protein LOC135836574 n=1 Tax=Planococcus citri TaxID=170843 RepID=UPI0031FA2C6E